MTIVERWIYGSYQKQLSGIKKIWVDAATPLKPFEQAGISISQSQVNLFSCEDFSRYKGVMFDGFGTLYCRGEALPGAIDVWNGLAKQGIQTRVLTNSASRSEAAIAGEMQELGFDVQPEQIIASGSLLRLEIAKWHQAGTLEIPTYVVGSEMALAFAASLGLKSSRVESMTRGLGRILIAGPVFGQVERKKILTEMLTLVDQPELKLDFHLFNPDALAPNGYGKKIPVTGDHALRLSLRRPHVEWKIWGKPFPEIFALGIQSMGLSPSEILMVGDTLGTDIMGANAIGMDSLLLTYGGNTSYDYAHQGNYLKTFPKWAAPGLVDLCKCFL
jgi:glycerol 3-phosphatase-2